LEISTDHHGASVIVIAIAGNDLCSTRVRNELRDFSLKKTEVERKKETKKNNNNNTEQTNRQQIGRISLMYRPRLLTIHNVYLKNFLSLGH